ncbi:MAG TPA: hypothetical protein VMU48_04620 [Terracidiphilus sp.]|nr:hypothetical protein [Terracidiphilus sp.]
MLPGGTGSGPIGIEASLLPGGTGSGPIGIALAEHAVTAKIALKATAETFIVEPMNVYSLNNENEYARKD